MRTTDRTIRQRQNATQNRERLANDTDDTAETDDRRQVSHK